MVFSLYPVNFKIAWQLPTYTRCSRIALCATAFCDECIVRVSVAGLNPKSPKIAVGLALNRV
jgi:hypothetical protein